MGDQYSGDEVRWYWLGCESGCSVSVPPPPRPAPEGRGPRRLGGRPRPRGAGRLGCAAWKVSRRLGSRMSFLGTQERSSGPYHSQSTKYSRIPPRRRESKISLTL